MPPFSPFAALLTRRWATDCGFNYTDADVQVRAKAACLSAQSAVTLHGRAAHCVCGQAGHCGWNRVSRVCVVVQCAFRWAQERSEARRFHHGVRPWHISPCIVCRLTLIASNASALALTYVGRRSHTHSAICFTAILGGARRHCFHELEFVFVRRYAAALKQCQDGLLCH